MGEVDVPLFCLALLPHDVDFVAGLDLGLAFVVENLGQRQHAFGLRADINHDVGGSELQHRAFEDVVLAGLLFFHFGGESFESGGKVIVGGGDRRFVFCGWDRRGWLRNVRRLRRTHIGSRAGFVFGLNRGRGVKVSGGVVVVQAHCLFW